MDFFGSKNFNFSKVAVPERKCTLSMAVEDYGRDPTLVWTLSVLNDMTLISGDSLGTIQVWDGIMGTMLQVIALFCGCVCARS